MTKELDKYHGKIVEVRDEQGNVSKQWDSCASLDWPYTIGAYKGKPITDTGGLNQPPGGMITIRKAMIISIRPAMFNSSRTITKSIEQSPRAVVLSF